MKDTPKNLPVSINDRLRNLSRHQSIPIDAIRQRYAMERFLYRLSKSSYKDQFILRGGMMFFGWNIEFRRPTMDIDLLSQKTKTPSQITNTISNICGQEVQPDGLNFHSDSISSEIIQEIRNYPGIRVKFNASLGTANIRMQIDVGFDDQITPRSIDIQFPTLLNFPAPHLKGYPHETMLAEKFQAMVEIGDANTRMKDFHDIWLLIQNKEVNQKNLKQAITNTFKQRSTSIPNHFNQAITPNFATQKENLWNAFKKQNLLPDIPNLEQVIDEIKDLIDSILPSIT